MRSRRRLIWGVVFAAVAASIVVPAPRAVAETVCAEPASGAYPERRDPTDVGMDSGAVAEAVRFGADRAAHAVQIYRHGCLVGEHNPTGNAPLPLASGSKGVASVAVGRAVTLGYFGVDDPIGRFFPEADPNHARLTVRQVLNQTTGLHFSWPADIAALTTGAVAQTLAAPVEREPGTTSLYAQNVLALLAEIIERTTGLDFQDFVQREVMAPLGIERDHWVWLRDRSGTTAVNGGLAMRPADLARIGRMLVQDGRWDGRQLIGRDYLRAATEPTAANGGYGFLWWLNAGDTYHGVNVPQAREYDHPVFPGLPRDVYAFSGALGQFLVMVPSRDMVIVRLGVPTSIDPANPIGFLTGTSNPENRDLFRKAIDAVLDQPDTLGPVPVVDDPVRPLVRTPEDLVALVDPRTTLALLLGADVYSSTHCNVLFCDGRPVGEDIFRLWIDVAGQVSAAVAALNSPPR
ncbi:serine hydrolase domain-containing protein [Nocardia barduliensis]|uniref:serine hydrolase domain-containing protein n=1 Tax=Nocardia barduliensis TaxID=2736643 RepID=UPI001573E72C|nr:serine hydrolase [Nocardia barduliensis]